MAISTVQNYYNQKKKQTSPVITVGSSKSASNRGPGADNKQAATIVNPNVRNTYEDTRKPATIVSPVVTAGQEGKNSTQSSYLTDYSADPFDTSSTTDRYLKRLKELENSKPADFQSQYTEDIQNIINSIKNREQFQTDDVFQSDLYQTMREQAIQNGQKAMRDTMGSAQAATGGYGSTYAQAAGQQAYDNALSEFNGTTLDIYDRVYNKYLQEGQDLYNQLAMYNNQDAIDYGRYRDTVSDYYNDLNYYAGRYDSSWGQDMTAYQQDQQMQQWAEQYAYQKTQDALAQQNWQTQFDYQKEQDALAQQNWQAQFDYQKEQDAQQLALAYARAASSGGRSSGSGRTGKSSGSKEKSSDGYAPIAAGVIQTIQKNGYNNLQAYDYVMQLGEQGKINEGQVDEILKAAGIDETKALKEQQKEKELESQLKWNMPYVSMGMMR